MTASDVPIEIKYRIVASFQYQLVEQRSVDSLKLERFVFCVKPVFGLHTRGCTFGSSVAWSASSRPFFLPFPRLNAPGQFRAIRRCIN